MKRQIRIMLVEDHVGYREVVKLTLEKEPDMQLCCQFGTAERALRVLQECSESQRPDIILLDLNLPGMGGVEALPLINAAAPEAKIIVLTQSNKESDVLRAITLGASGYLLKSSRRQQITEGIRSVMNGGATLDANVAGFLLKTLQVRSPKDSKEPPLLSSREMDVLALLANGLVQKEIAIRLNISNTTVITYITRIYEKLQVTNAPSAINKAHLLGLFPQ